MLSCKYIENVFYYVQVELNRNLLSLNVYMCERARDGTRVRVKFNLLFFLRCLLILNFKGQIIQAVRNVGQAGVHMSKCSTASNRRVAQIAETRKASSLQGGSEEEAKNQSQNRAPYWIVFLFSLALVSVI